MQYKQIILVVFQWRVYNKQRSQQQRPSQATSIVAIHRDDVWHILYYVRQHLNWGSLWRVLSSVFAATKEL